MRTSTPTSTAATPVHVEGAGGRVPALLWSPTGDHDPGPLLLLGHGGSPTGKDDAGFQALARRFADGLGVSVLAIDGPVHGERAPAGPDRVARFRHSRLALVDPALPAAFAADWSAAVDACRAVGVGAGPLLYAGFSMGTLLGVPVVAALTDVVAAVFGVGGVPAPGGAGRLIGTVAGPAAAALADELDDPVLRGRIATEAAATLTGTDVLMLNMTLDVMFPVDGAMALFDAFPGPKRIAFWEGGHTDLGPEAISMAVDFLRGALERTVRPGGHRDDVTPVVAW